LLNEAFDVFVSYPGGRPPKAIADLTADARKYAVFALSTIVQICAEAKMGRRRLAAACELLDRGFGRAIQAVDVIMLGRKLSELSTDELIALNSRLVSSDAVDAGQPAARGGSPLIGLPSLGSGRTRNRPAR
jgi:hypothetical protein